MTLGLGATLFISDNNYSKAFEDIYSLSFNGSTEYAVIPAEVDIDVDSGTLSFWVKLDTGGTNMQLFKASVNSNNNIQIYHKNSDNTLHFVYKAGGSTKEVSIAFNNEGDDTWRHLAMTWDTTADELKAYVNGTQVGSTIGSLGTWSGTIDNVYVARNSTASNSFYAGHVNDLSLFNTVERPSTIYNSGVPNDLISISGLIGYWKMEEGTGTTVADSSRFNNTMTLFNTPTWTTDVP